MKNLGDINGDRIEDIAIGMPCDFGYEVSLGMPIAYVIFGGEGIGSNGFFDIRTLNGENGFVISNYFNSSSLYYDITGIGDINADGVDDFRIGGPILSSGLASDVIIFGKQGIGSQGAFNVSTQTENFGFQVTGFKPYESTNYYFYWTVSKLGDVNGDKIADFSINAGDANYVIFGNIDIGSKAIFNVTRLTGLDGFKTVVATPDFPNEYYFLSGIGDINKDNITDFSVGGMGSGGNIKITIVFGSVGIGNQGILSLSDSRLQANEGFEITNVPLGARVYSTGDVNGDGIADLIIGQSAIDVPDYYFTSELYVVFGAPHFNFRVPLDLSTLNGSNGFAITLAPSSSWSTLQSNISPLCHADFNGDGIDDIFFWEETYNTMYFNSEQNIVVLFGRPDIGDISLKFPNLGTNDIFRIKLPWNYYSDTVISVVTGDFNHDGIDDVIIGPEGSQLTGSLSSQIEYRYGYLLFGDEVVDLLASQVSISTSETVIFSNVNLNATFVKNAYHNPMLVYNISSIQHGRFEYVNRSGIAIYGFTQLQVNQRQIQFVHDGSIYAPNFNVTVGDGSFAGFYPALPAAITYNYTGPLIVRNNLTINQGQTVVLSTDFLTLLAPSVTINSNIIYTVSDLEFGQFEYVSYPGVAITRFTQSDIEQSLVQFIQDGTENAPSYTVMVNDLDHGKSSDPIPVLMSFNQIPVLVNNRFIINQGEAYFITPGNLSARCLNVPGRNLTFIMSNIQHGQFEFIDTPRVAITQFLQADVEDRTVQFIPDGSSLVPFFNVAVSSGILSSPAEICDINFDTPPILSRNRLRVESGREVILSPADLSASDKETEPGDLIFTASAVQHGHFEDDAKPNATITQFLQERIFAGALKFIADKGTVAPGYNISVSDGRMSTPESRALVNFTALSEAVQNPEVSTSTVTQNAILGGVFGGLLLFMGKKLISSCINHHNLVKTLESEGGKTDTKCEKLPLAHQNLVEPLLKKLLNKSESLNLTGCRSPAKCSEYLKAIEHLIKQLAKEGINLEAATDTDIKRDQFLDRVVEQIRKQVSTNRSCRSFEYWYSCVAAEIKPKDIEQNAMAIANAVATQFEVRVVVELPAVSAVVPVAGGGEINVSRQ